MSKTVIVRKAVPEDALHLGARLRAADLEEIRLYTGEDPRKELLKAFLWPNTKHLYAIESKSIVIAMFGVAPSVTEQGVGAPWMLASDALVSDHSRQLLRKSKYWVHSMARDYRLLENYVYARNLVHIKWLDHVGFRFGETIPNFGVGRAPFIRFYLGNRTAV